VRRSPPIREHNAEAPANGRKDVQIGFSHPSFDLWLLLHFQQLSNPQDGSSAQVHEKLRGHPAFERFATSTSVLVRNCPTRSCSPAGGHADDCDPLRRDPSTDVWRLLQSLGIAPAAG
jgi:hypothetical protein